LPIQTGIRSNKVYRTIRGQRGKLDILFANAGIGEFAPLGQITEEHFDKQFDINVRARSSRFRAHCL
jgi:NAD(P)-dependent dehydrogenase (short-subunit alcohol dehydrogenase family)